MTTTATITQDRIDQAALRTRLNRKLAALIASARSHSDLDIALRSNPATRCPHCFGEGTTDHYTRTLDQQTTEPCRQCDGTGIRRAIIDPDSKLHLN